MDRKKLGLYLLIFVLGISAGLGISSISRQKETGSTAIATADASGTLPSHPGTSSKKIVGYYPDWKGYLPEKVRLDLLTHVVCAFAIPTPEGTLRPLENPETALRLIEDAHNSQVKVLLAVGGWQKKRPCWEFRSMDAPAGPVMKTY